MAASFPARSFSADLKSAGSSMVSQRVPMSYGTVTDAPVPGQTLDFVRGSTGEASPSGWIDRSNVRILVCVFHSFGMPRLTDPL